MMRWRRIGQTWCIWPARPIALVEMIGGSYLSASPQLSYRRLIEALALKKIAVHAWGYVPGFDHQTQANEAWQNLRNCKANLEARVGAIPSPIRLGHSLGCKLHLLAPDGGRNSKGLITLSFNNFAADRSIPILGKVAPSLGFHSEFSPSPKETMRLIYEHYLQPKNLLISFGQDKLDQSDVLLECLKKRRGDASKALKLEGDHLTPASVGLRKNLLGEWADDSSKAQSLKKVVNTITNW